jgi:hypothetical protein
MTTPDKPASFGVIGAQPEDEFEVRTLPDGSLIELVDGRVARVTDNPHDGVWLVCEFVDEHEDVQGDAETVLCYDIARLVRSGPAS